VTSARRIGVVGIKGGVGATYLAAGLSRLLAAQFPRQVGMVESSSDSPASHFMGLENPSRPLSGLKEYTGVWNTRVLDSYLTASPEGAYHIPLTQGSFHTYEPGILHDWIDQLNDPLQWLILDLSGFSEPRSEVWLARCHQLVVVTTPDPLGLVLAHKRGPGLSIPMGGAGHILWVVNQTHPDQPFPRDLTLLTSGSMGLRNLSYGGPTAGLQWNGPKGLPASISKVLQPILDPFLDSKVEWRAITPMPQIVPTAGASSNRTNAIPKFVTPERLNQAQELHQKILAQLREKGLLGTSQASLVLNRNDLEPMAREILESLVLQYPGLDREERKALLEETLQLAFGLGPLEPLLRDDSVTEIMVNGPHRVFLEKSGRLESSPICFLDEAQLRTTIERILAPLGRRIDESQPYVDGRLADGSRVNAIIPPLSLDGSTLTIRKFSKRKLTVTDLVRLGSLTGEAASFLGACVRAKKNIVVSGGTGSGKTTLLNVLSSLIPPEERVVTIEDSAELQLSQDHVVRLEGRPANLEGKGRVSIRDLVINSLRMRPDRIVVGEVRGGEALDMLQAMNTGHDGSLTTCHANSPRDAVSRLETMCLLAGLDLPLRAIREQVVRAVHLIVQQSRLPGGKRAVTHIHEVLGLEGDTAVLQPLFEWNDDDQQLKKLPFRASFDSQLKQAEHSS